MKTIKVLFLASEADPLVKVGGLGDVAGSLPHALQQLSQEKTGGTAVDIRLVIPFHSIIRKKVPDPEFLFDLEFVKKLAWRPDILHANDWHTALSVYALKLKKPADPFFKDVRTILSIHNLPFMGAGTFDAFDAFGLPPSRYPRLPWWAKKFPLPLGLQTADRVVAASPTYAQEILTPEYACGLETFQRPEHSGKF